MVFLRKNSAKFYLPRGGKRYDFQIERGGNPNLAWIGAMNLKILLCFFYTNLSAALSQKRMEYLFIYSLI